MTTFRHELAQQIGVPADGRLDNVADDLAVLTDHYERFPPGTLDFLLQHYGVAEPVPTTVTIKSSAPDERTLARVVAESLRQTLVRRKPKRYGVAAHAIEGGWAVVVIMQESGLELRQIPREVGESDVVDVRGTLPNGFTNPALYRTDPRGAVDEPLVVTQGRSFHGAVPCKRGRNQVEVTAEGPLGVTVLANLPLYCGVSAPYALPIEDDDASDGSDSELAGALFALANRERSQAGLPTLEWSGDAAAVAREHSEDMCETDFVGHVSPNTGGPADRVRSAGIKVSLVLENVARAPSVRQAHRGLMNSPGHRANILSPEATELGIGVARHESGELLVTQVFLRVPGEVDLLAARDQLVEEIALRRRSHRLRDWATDSILQRAAMDYAVRLAQSKGEAPAPKPVGLEGRYRQLVTTVEVVGSVEDFVGSTVERRHGGGYGVGVAQGDHDELGANVLYVVILIGVPVGRS